MTRSGPCLEADRSLAVTASTPPTPSAATTNDASNTDLDPTPTPPITTPTNITSTENDKDHHQSKTEPNDTRLPTPSPYYREPDAYYMCFWVPDYYADL